MGEDYFYSRVNKMDVEFKKHKLIWSLIMKNMEK